MGASLEPMTIKGYLDNDFTKPFPDGFYKMMINPESLKWRHSIEYNKRQAPGSSKSQQKYECTLPEELSFEVVIDCTGVVNSNRTDLPKEISALKYIMFTYDGEIHRPNLVKVSWGEHFAFYGVLTSFDISYTLFRPDGTPLRAKISLAFEQSVNAAFAKKLEQRESPDVSHLVTVEEGMTLPQLCMKVWQDESYYIQVARYNDLNKFRNLKGVQKLIFPPIITTA